MSLGLDVPWKSPLWTNTHLEIVAEADLCVAVHLGDLDVGEARELLFGQVLPHGREVLAVAAPVFVGEKDGGAKVRSRTPAEGGLLGVTDGWFGGKGCHFTRERRI